MSENYIMQLGIWNWEFGTGNWELAIDSYANAVKNFVISPPTAGTAHSGSPWEISKVLMSSRRDLPT